MNLSHVLQVSGVSYAYGGGPRVLHDVSLHVGRGEIVGLVGPNGSGKSTLITLIFDLLKLRTGSITIDGAPHRLRSGRQQAQYLSSNDHLPEFLRAAEYLDLLAGLYGSRVDRAAAAALFDRYGMKGRLPHLMEDFSHGMRNKTQLISAFLNRRPLTVIDETLNGIDIEALYLVERELLRMRSEGLGVLLCSHDFSMLERVADRIVFLDFGHVISDVTLDDLRASGRDVAALVMSHLDERTLQ